MQSAQHRTPTQHAFRHQWYAAYVKHQHEKKAAELLARKGLEVFLPLQKVVRRWKDRTKALDLPLFPGYLFMHCGLHDRLAILSTPGIFFLVESGGRVCPIPSEEIDGIRRAVESGVRAEAHPFVNTGDRVRICEGPLTGVSGILTRFKNQYRVVLGVELLQKAVSVEVDVSSVERIRQAVR